MEKVGEVKIPHNEVVALIAQDTEESFIQAARELREVSVIKCETETPEGMQFAVNRMFHYLKRANVHNQSTSPLSDEQKEAMIRQKIEENGLIPFRIISDKPEIFSQLWELTGEYVSKSRA